MSDYFEKFLPPRKAEIVRAVLKLADSHGFENITTKKIADRVGFVESALYRHVKKKDDLFLIILDLAQKMLQEKFNELENEPSPLKKMRCFFSFALDFLEEFPGIYHIIFSDAYYIRNQALSEHFEKLIQQIQNQIAQIIARGQERGLLLKKFCPDNLALNLLGVIHTSFTLWNVFKKRSVRLPELAAPLYEQYEFLLRGEN